MTALITGTSKGIGKGIALEMATQGHLLLSPNALIQEITIQNPHWIQKENAFEYS